MANELCVAALLVFAVFCIIMGIYNANLRKNLGLPMSTSGKEVLQKINANPQESETKDYPEFTVRNCKYYTRHQSLRHLWYIRFNPRSSGIPWPQKAFNKSEAWRWAVEQSWYQLMEERENLYNDEGYTTAIIRDISKTKAGSIKLWVNVNNPYAEAWDFGDINGVAIRKTDADLFQRTYGKPEIGKTIYVQVVPYQRGGNQGFTYKISYKDAESQDYEESIREEEKSFEDINEEMDDIYSDLSEESQEILSEIPNIQKKKKQK